MEKRGSRCPPPRGSSQRLRVVTCRSQQSLDSVSTAKWVPLQSQRKPPEERAGLGLGRAVCVLRPLGAEARSLQHALILRLAASVCYTKVAQIDPPLRSSETAARTEGAPWTLSSRVPVPRVLSARAQRGGVCVSSFLLCVCVHTGVQAHTRSGG